MPITRNMSAAKAKAEADANAATVTNAAADMNAAATEQTGSTVMTTSTEITESLDVQQDTDGLTITEKSEKVVTTARKTIKKAKMVSRGKQARRQRDATVLKSSITQATVVQKERKKPVRITGSFGNRFKFKLGYSPFAEDTGPSPSQCQEVFEILRAHHEGENINWERDAASEDDKTGPAHASKDVTFNAIVKTILSQATGNEEAISAERVLVETYPYTFCGAQVNGEIANYHAVRLQSEEKLADALASSGLQNGKARSIKIALDRVWEANWEKATAEEKEKDSYRGEAFDFVPGMLSLDFLTPMSDQEKLDWLMASKGIGVKTATCIVAFAYGAEIFAVDTHIYRICTWLGWCPSLCKNRDQCSMHLNSRMPLDIRYGLHQLMWYHAQKCHHCRGRATKLGPKDDQSPCPLEHLMDRSKEMADKPVQDRSTVIKEGDSKRTIIRKTRQAKEKAEGVKRKVHKVAYGKMTAVQAKERGFKLQTTEIDGDFGASRSTTTTRRQWVRTESSAVNIEIEMNEAGMDDTEMGEADKDDQAAMTYDHDDNDDVDFDL